MYVCQQCQRKDKFFYQANTLSVKVFLEVIPSPFSTFTIVERVRVFKP